MIPFCGTRSGFVSRWAPVPGRRCRSGSGRRPAIPLERPLLRILGVISESRNGKGEEHQLEHGNGDHGERRQWLGSARLGRLLCRLEAQHLWALRALGGFLCCAAATVAAIARHRKNEHVAPIGSLRNFV